MDDDVCVQAPFVRQTLGYLALAYLTFTALGPQHRRRYLSETFRIALHPTRLATTRSFSSSRASETGWNQVSGSTEAAAEHIWGRRNPELAVDLVPLPANQLDHSHLPLNQAR